jgi:DNA-binding NarL/FixJ family response regulator
VVTGDREGRPVIRVFLLDDHEVVRRGLAELIGLEADMEVVGEAGSVADALTRIPAVHPHVAVLDVRLPDGSGIEACREIRSHDPSIGCLMLTSYSDDEALQGAVLAGASGYVLKEIRGNDLVTAIRRIAAGESLLDVRVVSEAHARLSAVSDDPRLATLTAQERRILELIGEGMTNRQIGEQLHLAEKTIKNYVSSLLDKLEMQRRTQAAAYIVRQQRDQSHP